MQKMQETFSPQPIIMCFIHKRQKATHLCTDLRCLNNPILCNQCFNQNMHRTSHLGHESSLILIVQAAERLSSIIKAQSKEVQRIYSSTIGMRDHDILQKTMQKGEILIQQVENRIRTLKTQIQLQLDLLVKDFQKRILLEKEEFFKNLDNYHKNYIQTFDNIKKCTDQIMEYQRGFKYYSNSNTLLLKIAQEGKRKSIQWLINKKKIINNTGKILENPLFVSDTNKTLQSVNGVNMEKIPTWSGQDPSSQKSEELGSWIRKVMESWVKIPELKPNNEMKISDHKYVPYYAYNR